MRVAFLTANYAPAVGGAQDLVAHVAEGLVAHHGHQVSVITTDAFFPPAGRRPGHIAGSEEVIGGVTVRRYPVARRTHTVVRAARRVNRRLRGTSGPATPLNVGPLGVRLARGAGEAAAAADAVVGVAAPYTTLVASGWVARRGGAAHLALPLLHLGSGPISRSAVRSLRRVDGVAGLTSFERDWLAARGVPADRLRVLPPGCDPSGYEDLSPSQARAKIGLPDRPTVGYVGRMAPHKGIDTLLAAAPLLWERHPGTTVVLAGARTAWPGLDHMVAGVAPRAGDRLVVRTDFADGDKALLLAACDVVAFPSRKESFGMVTVEAWAARRPVVAADIPAVRSLIRPGVDGELVPPGAAGALADALAGLLDDPDRRRHHGAAGRKRAETEFAWPTVVDGWNDLLHEAVHRSRRAS